MTLRGRAGGVFGRGTCQVVYLRGGGEGRVRSCGGEGLVVWMGSSWWCGSEGRW